MSEIETRCRVRPGAILSFSIDICSYLDAQHPGDVRYAYRIDGEASYELIIATLEKVKMNLILEALNQENENEDDEDE